MQVLPKLRGGRLLADTVVDDLLAAYAFMRRIENRLQQWQDRQTHRLPRSEDDRIRLAYSLGYTDWQSCSADVDLYRDTVRKHFLAQLEGSLGATDGDESDRVAGLWSGAVARDRADQVLAAFGYTDAQRALAALDHLRSAGFARRLDESGRKRLDGLVPVLIRESGRHGNPEVTLERLSGILEAVGRRSAYFALLNENPGVLKHLTRLCSRSEFLTRRIATHPLLLDELIDPRVFERLPDREALETDLRRRLSTVGADDLESQLEVLKQFQRSAVFLVAVADLSSNLPLMKVSDRLTEIAETVLESCLQLASQQMHARYGRPRCGRGSERRESGFAIVGYGKLGGLELGYGSDLDLVFIHDSEGDEQVTEGPTSLDNGLFYGRLTRRLVHLLTTQTSSGLLYEVDTRLRPSGKGGLLVTSLAALESYQREQAWTWEHQALLRARAVAGAAAVRRAFETMRRDLLCTAVRKDSLRREVTEMREKMRGELGSREPGLFDVKQDHGGLADIEFLVQYMVLLHASEHPALVGYSDNVRQLESLVGAGIMAPDLAAALKSAYLDYRARIHRLALEDREARVSDDEFADQRDQVVGAWDMVFGS
jgi:glutamate-ammonia-ligase adenylyltransferase